MLFLSNLVQLIACRGGVGRGGFMSGSLGVGVPFTICFWCTNAQEKPINLYWVPIVRVKRILQLARILCFTHWLTNLSYTSLRIIKKPQYPPPWIVVVFWEVKVTETLQPPPHNTYYHLQSSIAVVPLKIIVVIFQVGSLVVPAMTRPPRPPQLLQPPPPQSVEAFLEVNFAWKFFSSQPSPQKK